MKLVQFGLPYSPNVGDGVIADCLAHEVRTQVPGASVISLDLSGRAGPGDVMVRNRTLALAVLSRLPAAVRGRVVEARLRRMLARVLPHWRTALHDADLAVIGGGQLFSDADLNFCVKVAMAADQIRAAGTPLAIHGAGVAANWSYRGKGLFQSVFSADLQQVGLRDAPSLGAWADQTAGQRPRPILTRDPGLLAAECYGRQCQQDEAIGLCITDPAILRYHAEGQVAGDGLTFFVELALALTRRGQKLRLFCNGAAEDVAALQHVAAHADIVKAIRAERVQIAAAPTRPADLCTIIQSCAALVAHRLHACIVGYAYGIPVVGLGWYRKLESFFASIGASQWFVASARPDPDDLALLTTRCGAAGFDPSAHAVALQETRQSIRALLDLVPSRAIMAPMSEGQRAAG